MPFREDHPNYKLYKEPIGYYYQDVPSTIWTPLESLIDEAGGEDRE